MSIETLRDRIDYLEKEWAKEKDKNAELKLNWDSLKVWAGSNLTHNLWWAQEDRAKDFNSFLDKMNAFKQ